MVESFMFEVLKLVSSRELLSIQAVPQTWGTGQPLLSKLGTESKVRVKQFTGNEKKKKKGPNWFSHLNKSILTRISSPVLDLLQLQLHCCSISSINQSLCQDRNTQILLTDDTQFQLMLPIHSNYGVTPISMLSSKSPCLWALVWHCNLCFHPQFECKL